MRSDPMSLKSVVSGLSAETAAEHRPLPVGEGTGKEVRKERRKPEKGMRMARGEGRGRDIGE